MTLDECLDICENALRFTREQLKKTVGPGYDHPETNALKFLYTARRDGTIKGSKRRRGRPAKKKGGVANADHDLAVEGEAIEGDY